MQGFGDAVVIAMGLGILFLPLTIVAALGYGALVAGEAGVRSMTKNKEEWGRKLIEHGCIFFGTCPKLVQCVEWEFPSICFVSFLRVFRCGERWRLSPHRHLSPVSSFS